MVFLLSLLVVASLALLCRRRQKTSFAVKGLGGGAEKGVDYVISFEPNGIKVSPKGEVFFYTAIPTWHLSPDKFGFAYSTTSKQGKNVRVSYEFAVAGQGPEINYALETSIARLANEMKNKRR